ncbi:ABC transporter substrate-binding protein [Candidatus Raskinella chloraquaticus]|uniref:ABC transporter substrate-binding protein n=1 Tax=Candidatus Raskinella chloraquaticus TaxID=1951219 RepID=UPI00366FDA73
MRHFLAIAVYLVVAGGPSHAKPRAVSLNVCTDQLLIDLADPEQILGVSTYARDPNLSWVAARAGPYTAVAAAEDVVSRAPDVVLAGVFNKIATRQVLAASGLRIEVFALADDFAGVRDAIARVGSLLQQEERAARRIAALDGALARLRQAASARALRILPLQRRGWVSGSDTLTSALLAEAGLVNIAAELGLYAGGQVGLERLIALQPDLILGSREEIYGEDQGSALLLHPALRARVPPERWIYIPGRLTVCGGPGLIEAIDALIEQLVRLKAEAPSLKIQPRAGP